MSDGRVYIGMWKDGYYHGDGIFYQQDGSFERGKWKDQMKQGLFVHVDVDGCKEARYYQNNILEQNTEKRHQIVVDNLFGTRRSSTHTPTRYKYRTSKA